MNKIISIIVLASIISVMNVTAQNNTTTATTAAYCDLFQNRTGIYCSPVLPQTIEKNAVTNNLSEKYNNAIADLQTIQNSNPKFNQQGFNQVVWAVKREAQIQEYILKFLKVIYTLIL